VTTAQDGGRLSALGTGRVYPQEMLLILICVRGWVDPRAILRSEGFYVNENPMTPPGIEPATFRLVAKHLNHCDTAAPFFFVFVDNIFTHTSEYVILIAFARQQCVREHNSVLHLNVHCLYIVLSSVTNFMYNFVSSQQWGCKIINVVNILSGVTYIYICKWSLCLLTALSRK